MNEFIGRLIVYEINMEKAEEIAKLKKEKNKSFTHNDETLQKKKSLVTVRTEDEESRSEEHENYVMAVREFKKFFKRKGRNLKQPYDPKKGFVGGAWSDSGDESKEHAKE